MLKINKSILLIFFIALSSISAQTGNQLIIQNADSLTGTANEDNPFRIYQGNVAFRHDDVMVYCDIAYHYFAQNMAILKGDVKLLQNGLELKSPYVVYNGNSKTAVAKQFVEIIDGETYLSADSGRYNMQTRDAYFLGNVFIEDDSVVIFTDYVHHNRESEISHTIGNSLIQGKFTNAMIKGDTISNYPKKNYTLAKGKPLLVQIDTIKKDEDITFDTLTVVSVLMETFRNPGNELYFFRDSVEIYKNDVQTRAQNTTYAKDRNFIKLIGEPVVWYDSTQLNADSIVITINDNELRSIKTFYHSIAMVKNDSNFADRINQISGDSLFIDFHNGKPVRLTSFDNAKSLYYLIDEEGGSGVERKNTDKVVVGFKNGEIEIIHWIGTTNGEYYPETLVKDPKKFDLPLFQWRTDKPKKRQFDLQKEK